MDKIINNMWLQLSDVTWINFPKNNFNITICNNHAPLTSGLIKFTLVNLFECIENLMKHMVNSSAFPTSI